MKKILLMTSLLITSFAASTFAAVPGSPQALKEIVQRKFMEQANDPQTDLGKAIAQIILDTADGRNPEGSIRLPITSSDFKIVTLAQEEITNPWHYADLTGAICSATNFESKYLVLLKSRTAVHMALEKDRVLFSVSSRVREARSILNNSTPSCNDPSGSYGPVAITLETDAFQLSEVTAK